MGLREVKIALKNGSGSVDLKYLSSEPDRYGNDRLYFRRNGKRTRLHQSPGTPEFMEEYEKAFNGEVEKKPAKPKKQTDPKKFGWLVEHYLQSPEFLKLGPITRRRRRNELHEICEEDFGKSPKHKDKFTADIRRVHVKRIRDVKADRHGSANDRLKALRGMFAWAVEEEHMETNPAMGVPYLQSDNPDGWHTWTVEEVNQYISAHPLGTKAYLALCVFLFIGARVSDTRTFGPQMERHDGTELHYKEYKGRKKVLKEHKVPILPMLREALDACPSGHLNWIVTEFGKPFSAKGLSNRMRKWCDEAGLNHCSAHGLRKAGATIAADNGATEYDLMSIYGWETTKQAGEYTKKADRNRRAKSAMPLINLEQNEDKIVALSEGVAEGETIRAKKPLKSKAK